MAVPAVNAAPLLAPQPAALADEPQVGNLQEREISILRSACRDKDEETGAVVARILSVAALVAGVFTAVMVPGVAGLIAGLAVYFVVGNLLSQTYHGLRNHAYLEAGQALHTRSFKEYIVQNEVVPTIDNILTIHAAYKRFAAAQAQQLQAPRPVAAAV